MKGECKPQWLIPGVVSASRWDGEAHPGRRLSHKDQHSFGVLHTGVFLQPRCAGGIKLQPSEIEKQIALFKNREKDQGSGDELKEQ